MDQSFNFHNPTKIYFGKDALNNLADELKNYGDNVLILYGRSAIKKIGLYDDIVKILNAEHKNIFELSGVMPNPTIDKVIEGAKLCKENKIDLILAAGGGSVIDAAKAISVIAKDLTEDPFKDYFLDKKVYDFDPIPVGSILTMVGTGSEMNGNSVVSDNVRKKKKGRNFGVKSYPKFSILNPEYTYSVSQYQMTSGIFDILSHLMEQYFGGDTVTTSDYVLEALMRCVIEMTPIAIKNPKDYMARSNLMWAATLALNSIAGCSKVQDWQVHSIEHQVSAFTDCAHGMGLAVLSTSYYPYIYKKGLHQFKRFAIEVWHVDPAGKSDDQIAQEGLKCLNKFIKDSNLPTTLRELGCTEEMLEPIAKSSDARDGYGKVSAEDILQILKNCF